jgi:hypothetical protein
VRFLQNDWFASVTRIIGSVSDEHLLEMARMIPPDCPDDPPLLESPLDGG